MLRKIKRILPLFEAIAVDMLVLSIIFILHSFHHPSNVSPSGTKKRTIKQRIYVKSFKHGFRSIVVLRMTFQKLFALPLEVSNLNLCPLKFFLLANGGM